MVFTNKGESFLIYFIIKLVSKNMTKVTINYINFNLTDNYV